MGILGLTRSQKDDSLGLDLGLVVSLDDLGREVLERERRSERRADRVQVWAEGVRLFLSAPNIATSSPSLLLAVGVDVEVCALL